MLFLPQNLEAKDIEVHVIGDIAKQNRNTGNHAAILLDTISKTISNCVEETLLDEDSCINLDH